MALGLGPQDGSESQAGSDLGAIITSAREEDGRFFLNGEKIFITNGGCEIHLVLARTPDAPVGTRGLSLFLVPKVRFDNDGARTQSLVMRSRSGTTRMIDARHRVSKLREFAAIDY